MGSTSEPQDLYAALATVKQAATTGNEKIKAELASFAQELAIKVDEPTDYVNRIGMSNLHELGLALVGCARGIFRALARKNKNVSLQTLIEVSGLDMQLLTRLLRAMVNFKMLESSSLGVFAANKVTRTLAQDYSEAAMRHYMYNTGPAILGIPAWIDADRSSLPTKSTPYMLAKNTDLHPMATLDLPQYSAFMRYQSEDNGLHTSWLDIYPMAEVVKAYVNDSSAPIFVDVGGAWGQQTASLVQKFPGISKHCIVQDLPAVVSEATVSASVPGSLNFQAHDFFTPQPASAHGAKIFYLRLILHLWDDDDSVKILTHLRDAMAEDSVIVIDEVLVPEHASGKDGMWMATVDMTMLSMFYNARERTAQDFESLAKQVGGLEVKTTGRYDERRGKGIVVLAKL